MPKDVAFGLVLGKDLMQGPSVPANIVENADSGLAEGGLLKWNKLYQTNKAEIISHIISLTDLFLLFCYWFKAYLICCKSVL